MKLIIILKYLLLILAICYIFTPFAFADNGIVPFSKTINEHVKKFTVIYYYNPGCPRCKEIKDKIEQIDQSAFKHFLKIDITKSTPENGVDATPMIRIYDKDFNYYVQFIPSNDESIEILYHHIIKGVMSLD